MRRPVNRDMPAALTLSRLMHCYDTCTRGCLDRLVGHGSDTAASEDNQDHGYLQQYRDVFRDSAVVRLYLFCPTRFIISDTDALTYLRKEGLVFLPLVGPENIKRDLMPPSVVNNMYLTVYCQLLYLLWNHLNEFQDATTEEVRSAVVVSFQNVPEFTILNDIFSRQCADLSDKQNGRLLAPIKRNLLQEIQEKYCHKC